jgi:DNA-binding transcriptional regulator YdaS (Cro superfamily)
MNLSNFIDSHPNKSEARRNLADKLGVAEVTVRSWANGNRKPSALAAKNIERATGGKVTAAQLLPEIFG